LGTSLGWGDAAVEAYRKALALWRTASEQGPVTGARLMRKLLDAYVDSRYSIKPDVEELARLKTEALQLAEKAGDEDEMWRVRTYSLVQILIQRSTMLGEVAYGLKMGNEAIAYFEQRNDPEALDYALSIMALYCWLANDHSAAIEVAKRRLSIQGLPSGKRGNAWNHIVISYFLMGDYDRCLTAYHQAFDNKGPEEPLEYYAESINIAMLAAYITGRWSEIDLMLDALAQVWERIQQLAGTGIMVFSGYMISLFLAKAHEDRPLMDAASSILERILPGRIHAKELIRAVREDEPALMNLESIAPDIMGIFLTMFSETGLAAPDELLVDSFFRDDMTVWCTKIVHALASGDNAQLAQAIDNAEAHHLVVHAARMRMVLAQRTRDRSQLERARDVLQPLGDIHYLRKLEEVEAALA
jgi:tetratricopeptide (TPR) repeat protein